MYNLRSERQARFIQAKVRRHKIVMLFSFPYEILHIYSCSECLVPTWCTLREKVLEILGGVTLTEGNSSMELPRSHATGNHHQSVSKEADLWRETPP